MSALTKKLAATVFPRYSHSLDLVNYNARLQRWVARVPATVPRLPNRLALYSYLSEHVLKGAAIDYLEFGVYRGASVREWVKLNPHPDSRFIGFDSFEGLPEHWTGELGVGAFDTGGRIPDIDDARVRFVKGWFQHTLPGFLRDFRPAHPLVIHNDSDLYSSTLYTLAQLNPLMVPGTILVFDEFTTPLHEYRAFNDFLSAFMRSAQPVAMTQAGRGRGAADQIAFRFD